MHPAVWSFIPASLQPTTLTLAPSCPVTVNGLIDHHTSPASFLQMQFWHCRSGYIWIISDKLQILQIGYHLPLMATPPTTYEPPQRLYLECLGTAPTTTDLYSPIFMDPKKESLQPLLIFKMIFFKEVVHRDTPTLPDDVNRVTVYDSLSQRFDDQSRSTRRVVTRPSHREHCHFPRFIFLSHH